MTSEQPLKVSVIVPSYNMAKYLPQTLDSILSQNYQPLEVIVVDDQSTDDTAAIVSKYVAQYPDIVRYIHRENGGEAPARNTGIRAATGDGLMFVDADDLLVEGAIATLAEQLMQLDDNYCLVHGEMESFDDATGAMLNVTCFQEIAQNRRKIFSSMSNMILASLVRRQAMVAIGLFPEHVKWSVITEAIMKLAKIGKFYSLDRIVYKYRVRPHSMSKSSSYAQSQLLVQQSQERLSTVLKGESLLVKIDAWAYHYLKAGRLFHDYDRNLARQYFLLSLSLSPFNLTPLKLLRASFLNKL